jgi:hypothetical protein
VFLEETGVDAGIDGPEPAAEDTADEVGRQRRKHWDASLNRPVAGFPEMMLREVVAEVEAATALGCGVSGAPAEFVVPGGDLAADAASRFLAGRGHTPTTIRTVQGYLELQRALESRRDSRPASSADQASHARRASLLEELQSRLSKD